MRRGRGEGEAKRDPLADLEVRVRSLERFQSWMTGLAIGAAAALGFFADYIKKHLGL